MLACIVLLDASLRTPSVGAVAHLAAVHHQVPECEGLKRARNLHGGTEEQRWEARLGCASECLGCLCAEARERLNPLPVGATLAVKGLTRVDPPGG